MGEVAQLKQAQKELGSKSFLEGGFRLSISVFTIVHSLHMSEELPQPRGGFFLPEEKLRKRKSVEPTTAPATAVSFRVAIDTHFFFLHCLI